MLDHKRRKVLEYAKTMKYEELQIEPAIERKIQTTLRQVGGPGVLCRRAHPTLVLLIRDDLSRLLSEISIMAAGDEEQ